MKGRKTGRKTKTGRERERGGGQQKGVIKKKVKDGKTREGTDNRLGIKRRDRTEEGTAKVGERRRERKRERTRGME